MSEATSILSVYQNAIYNHRHDSGHDPSVMVVGSLDYDTLVGACMAILHSGIFKTEKETSEKFEINGIPVFKCWTVERGFFPGSISK